jgi:hypothetical protein
MGDEVGEEREGDRGERVKEFLYLMMRRPERATRKGSTAA